MLGFLNLNKPAGWTSHDCVAKVRRLLPMKKVGHGGTLDPAATGVLPIAVGQATRLLQFLPQEKAYQATIRFGLQTTTDDLEGEIMRQQPVPSLNLEEVASFLPQFKGQISQIPPAYSAIQRGGKRLYQLARQGEEVEVPLRTVAVREIEVLAWHPGEFPELEVAIACGPGTYIRAIARDLGNALGVGGTLAALTRTESCGLKLSESITLEQLATQLQQGTFALIPPGEALKHLKVVVLEAKSARSWCQGQRLSSWQEVNQLDNSPREEFPTCPRVYHEDGHFLGIGQLIDSDTRLLLIPKIVLAAN